MCSFSVNLVVFFLGCADFVPEMVQQGGIITTAKFEPFASVVAQARCWIAQQHNIKIVSIQSIDYKLKSSWSKYISNGLRFGLWIKHDAVTIVTGLIFAMLSVKQETV